jgi:hypothetical protein
MHWNALQKLIWSIFLWSFFDYCSSTVAFSIIFSVVEVPARWLSWEPNSVNCSCGTILLYSRNLSQSCDYISKASNTSLYMKSKETVHLGMISLLIWLEHKAKNCQFLKKTSDKNFYIHKVSKKSNSLRCLTFSQILVGLSFFLHIAKFSLVLYGFYFRV